MKEMIKTVLLGLALSLCSTAFAADAEYAAGGAKTCLGCHDFSADSPVHAMLRGAHGQSDQDGTPMAQRGCEDCHGASAPHSRAPTQVSPGISYGPKWSATIADQDSQCLACHEDNAAKHWADALHMVNDLTCVTCHDIHQDKDAVLDAATQADVCTVCHKDQKSGIHALEEKSGDNPACTSCHNPHNHESAQGQMLTNRSEGCRSCHDLVAMSTESTVSDRAKSYHKVMAQQDRTCIDCHQDVSHGPAGAVAAMVPEPAMSRQLTLFYPGRSDSSWLLSDHPGSQPLRQGRNCQQCHRGDEVDMGKSLASAHDFKPATRDVQLSFDKDSSDLIVNVEWAGPENDADIAIMWGDGGSEAFRRGGCFAACHSDMPGMTRDRGQQRTKYLLTSQAQPPSLGQPAVPKEQESIDRLIAQGNFVETWRLTLGGDDRRLETATLLSGLSWQPAMGLTSRAEYRDGRWYVQFRKPLVGKPGAKHFGPDGKYTLGVALHGANNPAGQHWVSLPFTLSFSGDDTDFKVE